MKECGSQVKLWMTHNKLQLIDGNKKVHARTFYRCRHSFIVQSVFDLFSSSQNQTTVNFCLQEHPRQEFHWKNSTLFRILLLGVLFNTVSDVT